MASPPPAANPQRVYNMLQYLESVNLKETARTLERESGFFFNVAHFEELFLGGGFEEAEEYFCGFTAIHDNIVSTRTIFEIRKQKFIEALDNGNRATAVKIMMDKFWTFERYNEELLQDAIDLLMLDNIRRHPMLRHYRDTASARRVLMNEFKRWFLLNPALQGKLFQFPSPIFVNNNQHRYYYRYNNNNSNNSRSSPTLGLGLLNNVGADKKQL